MTAHEQIQQLISEHKIVLFMKGDARFPLCGFSGRAIKLLQLCGAKDIKTINVLENEELRQAIKEFSNWPTIPQLYINGVFIGGSDIMAEMYENGELKALI